jgi:hypothetical protein
VLQNCIKQLLFRQWLTHVDGRDGKKSLAITQKGQVFLEKWFELQTLMGMKGIGNNVVRV